MGMAMGMERYMSINCFFLLELCSSSVFEEGFLVLCYYVRLPKVDDNRLPGKVESIFCDHKCESAQSLYLMSLIS